MKNTLNRTEIRKFINLRRSFTSPVVGVTGNFGKTTTLEMIRCVLEKKGTVLKNTSRYSTWKTNIQTLKKLSPEYDYAAFEFDLVRGNNLDEILRIIKPDIGIVTNFGDAHLSYLGNMINIALQKSNIVKYLSQDGTAILNKDDDLCSNLAQYVKTNKVSTFGLTHNSDFFATDIEHLGPEGTRFRLNNKLKVTVPLYSLMDIYNLLAAIAALYTMGFKKKEIIGEIKNNFTLPDGRGRMHLVNGHYLIDESYLATARAVAKATRELVGFSPYAENLIYIISDMHESGPNVEEVHLNMGYFISALPINHVITVGPYAKFIGKGISLIPNKGQSVINCNSVNQIIRTLDMITNKKSAIVVQGIGQVGMRRLLKYFANKDA